VDLLSSVTAILDWMMITKDSFKFVNKEKALAYLADIYEGSNRPGPEKLTKAKDYIIERTGDVKGKIEAE
jgi:hypothetical protein